MIGLFTGLANQQHATEVQIAAHSHLMRTHEERNFDLMCIKNYKDAHGFEPHPFFNMVALRREYSMPWRKSPIPVVKRA